MKETVFLVLCMLLAIAHHAAATPQVQEKILYKAEMITMGSKPLEAYFNQRLTRPNLFTVVRSMSTACTRGYVGTWKIEDGALWLVAVSDAKDEPIPVTVFNKDWKLPVKATWFSGHLSAYKTTHARGDHDHLLLGIRDGKVVTTEKRDGAHPLKQLLTLEGISPQKISQATISTFERNQPPQFKLIAKHEYEQLIRCMETATSAPSKRHEGQAWSFIIQGGTYGYWGGIRFNVYPDGSGTYVIDGIGRGYKSKALAELADRIYESPQSKPATYENREGQYVAVPE